MTCSKCDDTGLYIHSGGPDDGWEFCCLCPTGYALASEKLAKIPITSIVNPKSDDTFAAALLKDAWLIP